MYFNVFFEALKKNNGNPVHYDVFGDRLWIKLGEDVNKFPRQQKEFSDTWNAWADMYVCLSEAAWLSQRI